MLLIKIICSKVGIGTISDQWKMTLSMDLGKVTFLLFSSVTIDLIIHQLDLNIKSLNLNSWIGTLTNSTLQEVAEIQTSSVSKHPKWNRKPHCHIWTLPNTTFEGKHLPVPIYRKTRNDEVRPLMNSTLRHVFTCLVKTFVVKVFYRGLCILIIHLIWITASQQSFSEYNPYVHTSRHQLCIYVQGYKHFTCICTQMDKHKFNYTHRAHTQTSLQVCIFSNNKGRVDKWM